MYSSTRRPFWFAVKVRSVWKHTKSYYFLRKRIQTGVRECFHAPRTQAHNSQFRRSTQLTPHRQWCQMRSIRWHTMYILRVAAWWSGKNAFVRCCTRLLDLHWPTFNHQFKFSPCPFILPPSHVPHFFPNFCLIFVLSFAPLRYLPFNDYSFLRWLFWFLLHTIVTLHSAIVDFSFISCSPLHRFENASGLIDKQLLKSTKL